jgi:putative protease
MELVLPQGNREFVVEGMTDMQGQPLEVAPGSGWTVRLPLPSSDIHLGLLARHI